MTDETRSILEGLGMDLNQTLARFVGNETLLFRFVNKFPTDETFGKLKAAVDAGDAEDAFHQAHTLKGVVGNLGLGKLFDAVDPMVEDLRNGKMDIAREQMPEIERLYHETVEGIQSINP